MNAIGANVQNSWCNCRKLPISISRSGRSLSYTVVVRENTLPWNSPGQCFQEESVTCDESGLFTESTHHHILMVLIYFSQM